MDSARALAAKGRGIAQVSRTMSVSRAQLLLQVSILPAGRRGAVTDVMTEQTLK